MSNFFVQNITTYQGEEGTKIQYNKVYFRKNKQQKNNSSGSITIPTTEELTIDTDDLVIEGLINDEYNPRELIKNYQVFRVVSVEDNRKGGLPHYRIGVSE